MRFSLVRRRICNCGPSSRPRGRLGTREYVAAPNRCCNSAVTTWREWWSSGKFIGGAGACKRDTRLMREAEMKRRTARRGAWTTATNVFALVKPANPDDIRTDIKNTLDARERLQTLSAT